jgi:hypothetical protein
MVYKTSEIYRTLKIIEERQLKGFKMRDVVSAKEHQNDSKLMGISTNLLRTLEDMHLIFEGQLGFYFTEQGHSVLKKYEGAVEVYGRKNVEIIPANVNGSITYGVRISPAAKIHEVTKAGQTISLTDKETQRRKQISDFLMEKGYIGKSSAVTKITKGDEKSFKIITRIPYHRAIEEKNKLVKLTERLGTQIDFKGDEQVREYEIVDSEKRCIATFYSKRRISEKKGVWKFNKPQPFEIEVNLEYPNPEVTTRLLNSVIRSFYFHDEVDQK